MIIVKLQGGLGNQLFQYAFGRALSKKNGQRLLFDTMYYKFVQNRKYVLPHFQTTGSEFSLFDAPVFYPSTLPVIGKPYASIYKMLFPRKMTVLEEKTYFVYQQNFLDHTGNVYVDGYFQHPEYVSMVCSELQKELQVREAISTKAAPLQKLLDDPSAVAVHVRRGDYVQLSSFGTCSPEYYHAGISYMKRKLAKAKFFFFSDDIQWVKQEFAQVPGNTYIEGFDEVTDFSLMKTARNLIIANSTFSWWAAYLGKKNTVVAPKKWVNYSSESEALILKDWVRIDR